MIAARSAIFLVMAGALGLVGCQWVQANTFPPVDRGKLRITLTRGACYGTCPDYMVTIDGEGRTVFSTEEPAELGDSEIHNAFNFPYVVAPGRHVDTVPLKSVDDLVDKFRRANFFALKDEYVAQITDNPTYVLEIDTGHGRKRVLDYVGREAGMPKVVTQLQDAVDQVAQTGRWVKGDDGLIDALQRESFDFRSDAAARMLLAAAEHGSDRTLLEFIRRGAPLERKAGTETYGAVILLEAIENGRTPLFDALAKQGWLTRAKREDVHNAFAAFAAGCDPALVDAAIAAGIPVDATTSPSHDERMSADGAETALASLATDYNCDSDHERLATAKRLLENGADPNKHDGEGENAIFEVEQLALLNLLLASGADPKVIDKQGNSAVFGSWNDEIVLRLLQAGASPRGRYFDGKTLLEQMRERPMPKVMAWLNANPSALASAKAR